MNHNIQKHFVLQLGALIALYVSITSILFIIFGSITILFPDAAAYYYESESARNSIRSGIAALMVFFPVFLGLTRLSNQLRRHETQGEYSTLGKWLVYLSLLIAGGVLLGDLVALIMGALNGELTTRFALKVLALFVIIGLAFSYYILDIRSYFTKKVNVSLYFAAGATLLVLGSIILGFIHIETPQTVREMRIDNNMVSELQNMQWRIEENYRTNESLPSDIAAIYASFPIPKAPEGRESYEYKVTGDTTYELCATFAPNSYGDSANDSLSRPVMVGQEKNYNWSYQAGHWCFDREIDNTYMQ